MKIRVLGCSGAIAKDCRTTSFLLDSDVLVDAGTGVGDLHLSEMTAIDHVLLTHAHLDHVAALPLMIDAVASLRAQPLNVYALPETISALKQHIFNGVIWPDFTSLPSVERPFLCFHPLALGDVLTIGGKRVETLPAIHTVPTLAFSISADVPNSHCWVFSGDTGHNPDFWVRVNELPVAILVIETAFSEREAALAVKSLHLCPDMLRQQLDLMRADAAYPILITHTKPAETQLIMAELQQMNDRRAASGKSRLQLGWLSSGQEFWV